MYIPNHPSYPEEFRGTGIRIEDDVAVTEDGPVFLTAEAVREIIDIEHVVGVPDPRYSS